MMRLEKGDVIAITLAYNKGYIYFTFISGNRNIGYLIEVYDYKSKELIRDVEFIRKQKLLFSNRYVFAIFSSEEYMLQKVGKVKLNFKNLRNIIIPVRLSITSNRTNLQQYLHLPDTYSEEDYISSLIDSANNKNPSVFDDWQIYEYGIVSDTGKLDFTHKFFLGNITNKYNQSMIFGSFYLPSDIIDFYFNKIDRITAEQRIFQ